MKKVKLSCGLNISVRYVPVYVARMMAAEKYPEPQKPTVEKQVFGKSYDSEYVDADYTRRLENYERHVLPYALRAAILQLAVVPDFEIDSEALNAARAYLPSMQMGDVSDYLLLCVLSNTGSAPFFEIDTIVAAATENTLTWSEVHGAARAMKSED